MKAIIMGGFYMVTGAILLAAATTGADALGYLGCIIGGVGILFTIKGIITRSDDEE